MSAAAFDSSPSRCVMGENLLGDLGKLKEVV